VLGLILRGTAETGNLHSGLPRDRRIARGDRHIGWAERCGPQRFGVWGYNLGAYAALRAAENDKRIRALVLDSVYDEPSQMVKVGVERNGLG